MVELFGTGFRRETGTPPLDQMMAVGHLERFRPERLSGRCRIGQETSAGAYSGDGLAPTPDVNALTPEPKV